MVLKNQLDLNLEEIPYASLAQFELLKKKKRLGQTPQLTTPLWLSARMAKELGYNAGEEDFLLEPLAPEPGAIYGRIPQPTTTAPSPAITPIVPQPTTTAPSPAITPIVPQPTAPSLPPITPSEQWPEKFKGMPLGEAQRLGLYPNPKYIIAWPDGSYEYVTMFLEGGLKGVHSKGGEVYKLPPGTITPLTSTIVQPPLQPPVISLTGDYGLLFKEYQRTGGMLDVVSWGAAGAPLRPDMETEPTDEGLGKFLEDLVKAGQIGDVENILRYTGVTEEQIDEIVGIEVRQQELEGLVAKVFPGLDLEGFEELVKTDFEGFITQMQTGGRTKEKQDLLRLIGFSPEIVGQILPVTVTSSFVDDFLMRREVGKMFEIPAWRLDPDAKNRYLSEYVAPGLRAWLERNIRDPIATFETLKGGDPSLARLIDLVISSIPEMEAFQALSLPAKIETIGIDILASIPWSRATLAIIKGVGQRTASKVFEEALSTGLDRWIAFQGRLPAETRSMLGNLIVKDRSWLIEKATQNFTARLAEKRGIQTIVKSAVDDTLRDIEMRWLPKATQTGAIVMGGVPAKPIPPTVASIAKKIFSKTSLTLEEEQFRVNNREAIEVVLRATAPIPEKVTPAPEVREGVVPEVTVPVKGGKIVTLKRVVPEYPDRGFNRIKDIEVISETEKNYRVWLEIEKRTQLIPKSHWRIEQPAIPKAEAEAAQTWTEAGIQPSMLPEDVAAIEIRPPTKGKLTQISMDDQMKLEQAKKAAEEAPAETQEAYQAQWEIEGLKAVHQVDPVAQWRTTETVTRKTKQPDGSYKLTQHQRKVGLDSFIPIGQTEFPDTLTVKQAKMIWPGADYSRWLQQGTKQYNKVPLDVVLDPIASELGFTGTTAVNDLVKRINQIRQEKRQLKDAEETIKREMVEKPLKPQVELTPAEVRENWSIIGQPKLNMKQIDALNAVFADYINQPSTISAWELTRELRRETRAGRAENLKARAQELIVSKGITPEEGMNQAIRETLSGELPVLATDYLEGLTEDMRDALFAKVYHVLKDDPYEMASTLTALTNALTGKPIPREPGIRGGSAYTRLQRVFGDQPKVLKAIDKIAEEKKPLRDVVEGIYHETGREPIPIDQETADYLRGLKPDIIYEPTVFREPIPVAKFEAPIEDAFRQGHLWPRPVRDNIVRALKELGMLPVDIGNFLRANKASVDFSFWRQQAALIASHPISFAHANIEAWRAIWSQKSAEASWLRITQDALYQIYEEAAARGGDFLRPLILPKGTTQWKGTEEYGYSKGVERMLPRFTAALPWVKLSARAFETGTNVHNWLIFKSYYSAMLRYGEQIASGQKKLKLGEAFDIQKEMVDFSKSLANFTARGSLGKFAATAPELSALFFAPRAAVGRILSVKDLINANPRVRSEAWKNAALFVGTFGGLILLGAAMGWWEVERDPRNAEYMSIRIGNTRIDPWGGFRQFLVFFARAVTGTGVSSVTGAEYEADPINLIQTFIRGKASPLASLILDFWRGKTFIGEEVDVANKAQWAERVAPFAIWDIYEAFKDDPIHALQVAIPAIVGAGVQTYTGDWKENYMKLGLPKYSENLAYGLTQPRYDLSDFWSDTVSQFQGVDPATLTKEKGFPPYIKDMVETKRILEEVQTIPNQTLVRLNADPSKGATFADYYKMWRDRQSIVSSGDEVALAEFDKKYPGAELGNFSQRQFALLNEYWMITDKEEQAEFLETHEAEIGTNLRQDWLRSHPAENARLALYGQADLLTKEAYTQYNQRLKIFDYPDSAIPEMTLPPEGSVDAHFERIDTVEKWGANSWEDKLLRANNPELNKWLGLGEIDTPIASLELKVKNRDLFDKLDAFSDKDSPDYIADEEDRAEAVKKFRTDNPEFVDDTRRIEAIEKGAIDYIKTIPLPPQPKGNEWILRPNEIEIPPQEEIKTQKDIQRAQFRAIGLTAAQYHQVIDSWIADHPEETAQLLEEGKRFVSFGWITDPMQFVRLEMADAVGFQIIGLTSEKSHEFTDRLFPGLRGRFAQVQEGDEPITSAHVEYGRLIDKEGIGSSSAEAMLFRVDNPGYDKWRMDETIWGDKALKPIDQSKIPIWRIDVKMEGLDEDSPEFALLSRQRDAHTNGFPDMVDTYVQWYETPRAGYYDDWFLMENKDFYDRMVAQGLLTERDFSKVPALKWREEWDTMPPRKQEAIIKGVPETYTNPEAEGSPLDDYVAYYEIPPKPADYPNNMSYWEDDWWMMEHPDFYQEVYLGILGNQRKDYRKVPTRQVYAKYLVYDSLKTQSERKQYRRQNLDLDAWGQIAFGWKSILKQ